ncbi:hypothetical protein C2857_001004 [Epichloe festucae Fl1]|uniref:Uncharacterized protein n=1 Tax=Epichloe festucae (strain Fl1) TaxID=877507 RepID=A0A7S9KN86_EPIFF|nr:hypothetical protein C2857_001004 [Epichloe festucae Fl1]
METIQKVDGCLENRLQWCSMKEEGSRGRESAASTFCVASDPNCLHRDSFARTTALNTPTNPRLCGGSHPRRVSETGSIDESVSGVDDKRQLPRRLSAQPWFWANLPEKIKRSFLTKDERFIAEQDLSAKEWFLHG